MTHSTPTPETKRPRSRRGLRVALVASLMVNVLVIGVMAGGMMRYTRSDPAPHMQPDFRSLWRALPDEARDDLRAQERARGVPGEPGNRPSREERRARIAVVNGQILEMLRSETFDGAAFAALLGTERETMAQRLDAAQTAFADRVATLTHAQRMEMAESLTENWGRHPTR